MKVSKKGLDLIKKHEGCVLHAYLCPAGILTIGYGHTGPDVTPNLKITQTRADFLLSEDVNKHGNGVMKALGPAAKTILQEEFDAFVSLAFNIGVAAFAKSTVCKRYKAGDKAACANAFAMWNKARVKGVLQPVAGLTKRRAEEAALFLSGNGRTLVRATAEDVPDALVPETSIVPETKDNDRPLVKTKEVIVGSGLGVGGILNTISSFTIEDANQVKNSISEVKVDTPIMQKFHVPEMFSGAVVMLGIFIVYKRITERKNGMK